MDVAQSLIQRRGINGFSFQHISDAVGIKKASVHYHFPTKEDLVEAMLDRFSLDFDERLRNLDAADMTAAERLTAYIGMFENTFFDGDAVCLYGMLGAELASLAMTSALQISAFYRRNIDWLDKTLRRGQQDGSLHFVGKPDALAMMIFSALEGGMLVARADKGTEQYRVVTRELLTLLGIEPTTKPTDESAHPHQSPKEGES